MFKKLFSRNEKVEDVLGYRSVLDGPPPITILLPIVPTAIKIAHNKFALMYGYETPDMNATSIEWCGACGLECETSHRYVVQQCEHCGSRIVPCADCIYNVVGNPLCSNCPLSGTIFHMTENSEVLQVAKTAPEKDVMQTTWTVKKIESHICDTYSILINNKLANEMLKNLVNENQPEIDGKVSELLFIIKIGFSKSALYDTHSEDWAKLPYNVPDINDIDNVSKEKLIPLLISAYKNNKQERHPKNIVTLAILKTIYLPTN